MATVEVLGEFGPARRYTRERAGGVQADRGHTGVTRRGLPGLAVKLTELRLTPDEGPDAPSCGRALTCLLL